MKEYIPIIVSVLAGLFALFSAVTAWRLKHNSDEKVREALAKDSAYKELKDLYVTVHETFEELIKETKSHGSSDLSSRFSKLTAELQMIASDKVMENYLQVADSYSDWASLFHKAYPAPRLFIILCQVNFTDRYGFLSAPQNGLRAVIASNSNFGWGESSAQRPSIYPRKAA